MTVVAAEGWVGKADRYCDGVADEEEINAALASESTRQLRGMVLLVGEAFLLADAMVMKDGVILDGAGSLAYTTSVLTSLLSFNNVSHAKVLNLGLRDDNGGSTQLVSVQNAEDVEIAGCRLLGNTSGDGILIRLSNAIDFHDNYITGLYYFPVELGIGTCAVTRNTFQAVTVSSSAVIYVGENSGSWINGNRLIGVYGGASGSTPNGVSVQGDARDCSISNNEIRDQWGGGIVGNGAAIKIGANGKRTHVASNHPYNNGNRVAYGGCEDAANFPQIAGGNLAVNCTPSRVAVPVAPDGGFCLQINKDTAGGAGDAVFALHAHTIATTNQLAGLIPGNTYRWTGKVYVPASVALANVLLRLSFYSAAAWTDYDFGGSLQDVWEAFSLSMTIPAAATGMRCYAQVASAEALNDQIFLDYLWLRPDGPDNDFSQQYADAGADTRVGNNAWEL